MNRNEEWTGRVETIGNEDGDVVFHKLLELDRKSEFFNYIVPRIIPIHVVGFHKRTQSVIDVDEFVRDM
jgi:hypothetical protein